jgi:hypothetical protein
MGTARSLLVVAGIISGLSFGSTPSSAERNRDHRFSFFDIFDSSRRSSGPPEIQAQAALEQGSDHRGEAGAAAGLPA